MPSKLIKAEYDQRVKDYCKMCKGACSAGFDVIFLIPKTPAEQKDPSLLNQLNGNEHIDNVKTFYPALKS